MKIVNRRKFIKSITVLFLTVITVCLCFGKVFATKDIKMKETSYLVTKGETLWTIAKQYAPENEDLREYIYNLKKVNENIATIYEGQTITILVEDK